MAKELEINWEGDAPGLKDHRLSVAAFGEPLTNLLAAIRRIATNIVGNALDEGESGNRGRFANTAKQIDVEIESIKEGSTGLATVLAFNPPAPVAGFLFGDVAERTGIEFLDSIQQESTGQFRNAAVRKYLGSLPAGIKRQRYNLHDNGRQIRSIEVGEFTIPAVEETPYLREIVGEIAGVGFEPGRNEVRVKTQSSVQTLPCTADRVEAAISMRGSTVRALALVNQRAKLLSLTPDSHPRFQVNKESIDRHIFARWNGLLQRLAK